MVLDKITIRRYGFDDMVLDKITIRRYGFDDMVLGKVVLDEVSRIQQTNGWKSFC